MTHAELVGIDLYSAVICIIAFVSLKLQREI